MVNGTHRRPTSPAAIVSLILGIASVTPVGWLLLGTPGWIAIWLGWNGVRATESGEREGRVMAAVGMGLGAVGAIIGLIILIALLIG